MNIFFGLFGIVLSISLWIRLGVSLIDSLCSCGGGEWNFIPYK